MSLDLPQMVNNMSEAMKGLRPRMIFLLDDNKADVEAMKARLRKRREKFMAVRPINYFLPEA